MKTSTVLLALFSIAGFEQAIAAPVSEVKELQTRATGTGDSNCDPRQLKLTVTDASALTFDADCWAMQCGGRDRVMQRAKAGINTKHRQIELGSAANKRPFKDPSSNGIKKLPLTTPWGLNQAWDSAEEFPFASTMEGGKGAYLIPVNLNSQESQKNTLSSFYSRKENGIKQFDPAKKGQPNAEDGTWFEITEFEGPIGPYCKAYNKNDNSVCSKSVNTTDPRWGYDPGKYAYVYDHATETFKYKGK